MNALADSSRRLPPPNSEGFLCIDSVCMVTCRVPDFAHAGTRIGDAQDRVKHSKKLIATQIVRPEVALVHDSELRLDADQPNLPRGSHAMASGV